jgi:hypothetical protein
MAAVLVAVVVTAGLMTLRMGGLRPAASGSGDSEAGATPYGTPRLTALVARLPMGQWGTFSWAPDGMHVLIASTNGSTVYDRFGNVTSSFGQFEGWLDSTHLISGDGHVAGIDESYTGGPTSNSWVVANGHGSAAIIVAVPACTGDPLIDWYKNGQYVKAGEKATPYGWSSDGKLVLLGHLDCGSLDAETQGWKGSVDVQDFATGRVLATVPNVRGQMAFNPSATRLAAQSDQNLEIVDIATGQVKTVPDATLLGWSDDDRVYVLTSSGSLAQVGATAAIPDFGGVVVNWEVPSSAGPALEIDSAGHPIRIAAANGKTTLLDLSATDLTAALDSTVGNQVSSLQKSLWSPDGGLLAVPSSDGTSLALFSVTDLPGSVASALPTPIGSPQAIAELDRSAIPWPVGGLTADATRNAFWFLGGDTGKPIDLCRYDVATAKLSIAAIDGTVYNEKEPRDSLAIAPDGKLWIGAGLDLIVYDPDTGGQTHVTIPATGPDVQPDPTLGQPDPWVAGIAFDAKNGVALVARNWVRSLARVDSSLRVTGSVDVSDGFPMTGGVVFSGGRAFVVADPATGFGFGVDATGMQTLSNLKFSAPSIAEWGDRLLTAGTPPGYIGSDGGGAALIEPVPATADLVATGPNGVAALYDARAGAIQLRDAEGKVSGQGVFPAGAAPHIVALAFDGQGRLWALEAGSTAYDYSLVRLSLGA